jgi:hypothetical protein
MKPKFFHTALQASHKNSYLFVPQVDLNINLVNPVFVDLFVGAFDSVILVYMTIKKAIQVTPHCSSIATPVCLWKRKNLILTYMLSPNFNREQGDAK